MKLKAIQAVLLTALGVMATSIVQAQTHSALMEPAKSVFEHYAEIQTTLAADSLNGVSAHASAVAEATRGDTMKMLPPKVAEQAETLAHANDLESARAAFKPLSQSLIQYIAANPAAAGQYHEVYCPMAKASWLQTSPTVENPYFGKAMLRCGEMKGAAAHDGHNTHH